MSVSSKFGLPVGELIVTTRHLCISRTRQLLIYLLEAFNGVVVNFLKNGFATSVLLENIVERHD